MLHRLGRVDRGPSAEPTPLVSSTDVTPVERRLGAVAPAPGPASLRPVSRIAVAAISNERKPAGVCHRGRIDEEWPDVDVPWRPLVVVRPQPISRSDRPRPRGHEDLVLGQLSSVSEHSRWRSGRRRPPAVSAPSSPRAGARAAPRARRRSVGNEPRIALLDQRRQRLEHPVTDVRNERARLVRRKQVERRPLAPRVGESVVDIIEPRHGRPTAERLAQQPQLLEVPDVSVVPHERRLQLRELPHEVIVRDGREQLIRVTARLDEVGREVGETRRRDGRGFQYGRYVPAPGAFDKRADELNRFTLQVYRFTGTGRRAQGMRPSSRDAVNSARPPSMPRSRRAVSSDAPATRGTGSGTGTPRRAPPRLDWADPTAR